MQDGKIPFANPVLYRLVDYSEDTSIGMNPLDLVVLEDMNH